MKEYKLEPAKERRHIGQVWEGSKCKAVFILHPQGHVVLLAEYCQTKMLTQVFCVHNFYWGLIHTVFVVDL